MGKEIVSLDLFQAREQPHLRWRFAILAAANAAAVAALHSSQSICRSLATSFGDSSVLWLAPTLALAGYASGVAIIAFVPASRGYFTLERQLGFLVIALTAASAAPNVTSLGVACFLVGIGAAAAPRLLANATRVVSSTAIGGAIGRVICGSLAAILCVRLLGESAANVAGWRSLFLVAAAMVTVLVMLGRITGATRDVEVETSSTQGRCWFLWRSHPLLRHAAAQQAALFAAYNAGWMTALIALPDYERRVIVVGGSCAGIAAALAAGRLSDRVRPQGVAKAGAAAVLLGASLILPVAYNCQPGMVRVLLLVLGMALVDAGLQVALVANQTRVQALVLNERTRLAATLTVSGFLGGAIGAGTASWLWHALGWQGAVGLLAACACMGFCCSFSPKVVRLAKPRSSFKFFRGRPVEIALP